MRGRPTTYTTVTALTALIWLLTAGAGSAQAQTAAAAPAPQPSGDAAQIEKGRQAVGTICVGCHNNIMRMLQVHKKSPAQWKSTVYSMIGRGAMVLPEEVEPLTAFLASNTAAPARPANAAGAAAAVPASAGQAILERTCQQCHDLATATKKPPADDWNTVVTKMVNYGARLGAADQQTLVEHLNAVAK
jgi:mono/diheme cytochrome c family protein